MQDLSKSVKHELRELAGTAYEAEMTAALVELYGYFSSWKENAIDCWQLHDIIHEFHDGKAREMWKFYSGRDLALEVARGLSKGLIDRQSLSEAAWHHVEALTRFLSDQPEETAR